MADNALKNKYFRWIYTPMVFLIAVWANVFEVELYGAAILALVAGVMLIISSRLTDAMYPVLLITVFVTRLYNLLGNELYREQLFQIIWLAVPVVGAMIFHFIYYRKPIKLGSSFYGLCGISLALILGGVGTISVSEYTSPTALFYVFALGVGMVIFYILIKPHMDKDSGRELSSIMYLVGLFACFMVVSAYIKNWDLVMTEKRLLEGYPEEFQCGNNVSTFIMLALPFPVYYASKNPWHMLSVVFMYVSIIFTGSKGGLLMGSVELFVLLLAYVILYPENKKQRIIAGAISSAFVIGAVCCIPLVAKLIGMPAGENMPEISSVIDRIKAIILGDASRTRLLERMVYDFKSNPIFGVGIGYTGNENIYNPVDGAMNWYHMWFAQVIGGLGIMGILAYGFQLFDRVRVFLMNRSRVNLTLMLSYVGLFLMSQVNPGEFCPVPYSMLAVTFFAIVECRDGVNIQPIWVKKIR